MMDYESGPVRVTGMGLFESVSPIGLCAMSDGADPPTGGAADVLGGDPPAADPPAGDPPAGDPPADPEWLKQFSAEGGDADNPSHRDWLKSKGVKSLDDLAKSYRETEKAFHAKNSLVVPGEGAKPEEIAAFNKAIGVPDKAEDYAIELPEGVKEDDLDMDLLNPLKEQALAAGVPLKGFQALVGGVIKAQLDGLQASATAENGSRDELFKEWGAQKDAKMADVQAAMRSLNLNRADVAAIQRGFAMQYKEPGSRRTLELLAKLGAGMAEDVLLNPEQANRKFGISGADAQAEIDRLIVDREFGDKLSKRDPDAVARWDRLNGAVAAARDAEARRAAAA